MFGLCSARTGRVVGRLDGPAAWPNPLHYPSSTLAGDNISYLTAFMPLVQAGARRRPTHSGTRSHLGIGLWDVSPQPG